MNQFEPSMQRHELVGRDPERARIEACLASLTAGQHALVIRGVAGIGKTALWRHAVDHCRTARFNVLVARPTEEERRAGWVALLDLFEGNRVIDNLAGPDHSQTERGRAVLNALRELADDAPTVIAIDDAPLLDSITARALRFALRRLEGEQICVLTTERTGSSDRLDLERTVPAGSLTTLDLEPLDVNELRTMLASVVPAMSRPVLKQIHEASGGNALYALAIARMLPPEARMRSSELTVSLPASLEGALLGRLDTVPDDVIAMLDVVAAETRTTVGGLSEALPEQDVGGLLSTATELGLLTVDDSLEIRFSHPMIGPAIYSRMSPLERRSLHAHLAPRSTDPESRARHLALSTDEPDAEVAASLDEAVEAARNRSAYDAAASFAAHARRLTPPDGTAAAHRRTLIEIECRARAGEVGSANALADELIRQLPSGPDRARALVMRADLMDEDLAASAALLLQALDESGDDEHLRAEALDSLAGKRVCVDQDIHYEIDIAREALTLAERSGDPNTIAARSASLAMLEAFAGIPQPALSEEAPEAFADGARPTDTHSGNANLAKRLMWAGDLTTARSVLLDALDDADRLGNEHRRGFRLNDLAALECAAGNFKTAAELAQQGVDAALDAEDMWLERLLLYPRSLATMWRGDIAAARTIADRHLEETTEPPNRPGTVRARIALGLIALSRGDFTASAVELELAAETLQEMGIAQPGAFPVLPNLVEAAARAGDTDRVERWLPELQHQADRVGTPWAQAAVAFAEGIVDLCAGRSDQAARTLAETAAGFDALGFAPEAARAVLAQGQALLRDGKRSAAAAVLEDARRRFADMGAPVWEASAAQELERTSPGGSSDRLTATEDRIAHLVVEGKKNREIAEALFIALSTVEA
ncbi:MAG: AAA family ATPase, partial [Acidimicrobiia bacterium]